MARSIRRRSAELTKASSLHEQITDTANTFDQNNALESQNKTFSANISVQEEGQPNTRKAEAEEDDSETSEGIFGKIARFRESTWWFIGAVIIAIPLAVIPSAFSKKVIAGIRVTGFLAWIEIIWTAGWVLRNLLWLVSQTWKYICYKNKGWGTWDGIFSNTAWTLLGFALSLVAWGSSSIMCHIGEGNCNVHWLKILRKILLASIPVAVLFLAEDLLVEIMATVQAGKMAKERHIEAVERRVNIMGVLPKLIGRRDVENGSAKEQEQIQRQSLKRKKLTKKLREKLRAFCLPPDIGTLVERILLKSLREPDEWSEWTDAYERLWQSELSTEQFAHQRKIVVDTLRENMLRNEIGESTVFDEISLREKLATEQGKELNSRKSLNDKPFTVAEIMDMMDKDDDGEITLYELTDFMTESLSALIDILRGLHGINRAARSVSLVVGFLLLFVAAIIYAAFFVKNLTAYLTPIWTTVTGLSFALGGTATEFIAACQFVFSKQPYNVGDRVIIEDKELIVDDVCLLYTVFHRYSDGAMEQIAHKKICDSWITNLSRSKGLSIKEAAATPDNAGFITTAWLEEQQDVLVEFIKIDPVRKRYLDAKDVKLSLQTGKDEHQQVVAEIRLRELIVRHENVLARARGQIREKLQQMLKYHARQGPPYAVPPPPLPPRSNVA